MVTSSPKSLAALADPTRRRILEMLSGRRLAVKEIAAEFDVSRPAISKHLRVLRDHGLVGERREGRQRIHELVESPLREALRWLDGLLEGGGEAPEAERPAPRRGAPAASTAGASRPEPSREPKRAPRTPAEDEPSGRRTDDWRSW